MNPVESNLDDIRVSKLHDYQVLDTPPELDFDELVKLVAQICHVPAAVISFVDQDRQWLKARIGTELQETPRSISFCTHTIQLDENQVLVVNDTRRDPRFVSNPLVTGPENIRFYAGVPLVTRDGYALGALCALDHKPRSLTTDEMVALRTLARQVVNNLEMRHYHRAHLNAKQEVQKLKTELEDVRCKWDHFVPLPE